ncbi:MAG: hypothetical protein JRI36_00295 [Deltaproteobacteria bacterium]|nr:hypothetical protein [Deltaproteobacteria bacterium]
MKKDDRTYEDLETRCPKLGGPVPFSYCLQEAGKFPCARAIACWRLLFPVEAYLRHKLSKEQWENFCHQRPKDKITSLLELIEKAKKATKDSGSNL